MRKIRSLNASKLKTIDKMAKPEIKVRKYKNHIRFGDNRWSLGSLYGDPSRSVWCGMERLPMGDVTFDEADFLSRIRNNTNQANNSNRIDCSCCLNMIQRSIRQKMLGIQ
jgi:hypothetical protein